MEGQMSCEQAGTGKINLHTVRSTAVTGSRRQPPVERRKSAIEPVHGRMAPFTGKSIGPCEQSSIHHHTAAHPGTQNDADNNAGAPGAATSGFGKGETVRVVGDANPRTQL